MEKSGISSMKEKIQIPKSEHFFTHNKNFYQTFFRLMLILAFQNIITYTVNVADNLMLGSYSQSALSGAAAVNQIQFVLQQVIGLGFGQGLVILGSQYWGQKKSEPIQILTGIALKIGLVVGILLFACAFFMPERMISIFTDVPSVAEQALLYLSIIKYTYLFFVVTSLLLASLRSVQVVKIAFLLSVMTVFINVSINYCLIFGQFGFPEMGIKGAAIGTLIARIVELMVLLSYIRRSKAIPFTYQLRKLCKKDPLLLKDYWKVTFPCVISEALFAGSIAMQTAIFGHLDTDAIAANAVTNTMFQYCKMVPLAAAAASSVLIGMAVGKKDWKNIRAYVHSLQLVYLGIGISCSLILICISRVVLQFYDLTPAAEVYARQMFWIMTVIIVASSYQMPCLTGIIPGGGDSAFVMLNDVCYAGCFTIPVCLIAAFVFHLGILPLFFLMNVDQLLKCITNGIKTNSYTWVKRWVRE